MKTYLRQVNLNTKLMDRNIEILQNTSIDLSILVKEQFPSRDVFQYLNIETRSYILLYTNPNNRAT